MRHDLRLIWFAAICLSCACSGSDEPEPRDVTPTNVYEGDMPSSRPDAAGEDLGTSPPDSGPPTTGGDEDMGSDLSVGDMPDEPPILMGSLRAAICKDVALPDPAQFADMLPGGAGKIAEAGTTPERTEKPFRFLEGPVWVASQGKLYFSDFNHDSPLSDDMNGPPSIIYSLDPGDETVTTFSPEGVLRTNGLAIDEQGRLLASAHDRRQIVAVDLATNQVTVLAQDYQGKAFNQTNDLVASSSGLVYFTDPAYNGQLDGRQQELDFEGVFVVDAAGTVTLIDDSIHRPNGITLSPDERTLYVASRGGNKVYRYPLDAQGMAGARELFLDGPSPDGVAMDCAGNLYLAIPSKGVDIYGPQGGERIKRISARRITNIAFGGADHRTLYITEQNALRAVTMPVPGFPY